MNGISHVAALLAAQASKKRGHVGKSTSLPSGIPSKYLPFSVGALGNFPYYWKDPATLDFNHLTYEWISSGLLADSDPVKLDGVFTNRFLNVISKIVFVLSKADQKKLLGAQGKITQQQHAVLTAWEKAFGSIPIGEPGNPSIDNVVAKIVTEWALPTTHLYSLINSKDPKKILNKTPKRGEAVIPALMTMLSAISSVIPLLDLVTHNNGLLGRALEALQIPSDKNGAILTNEGKRVPAYSIRPSVKEIIAGLSKKNDSDAIKLNLQAIPMGKKKMSVSDKNNPRVEMRSAEILSLRKNRNNIALSEVLSCEKSTTELEIDFPGSVQVHFAPVDFVKKTVENWFWPEPIIKAQKNTNSDVSGFKFALDPGVNFSDKGSFGYLTSVLISNYPSIKLSTSTSHAVEIESLLKDNMDSELCFLDRNIGVVGARDGYTCDRHDNKIILKPTPSDTSQLNTSLNPTAFVLGVTREFPGAPR
jgi:hypothetical protein